MKVYIKKPSKSLRKTSRGGSVPSIAKMTKWARKKNSQRWAGFKLK